MDYTASEVLSFVRENDVRFIRLAFCDIFGTMKNISIMPQELSRAFDSGISFDGSAVAGFSGVERSDLLLFPDPKTLAILPWRPQQGRVARLFCDIRNPDGSIFWGDTRSILKQVSSRVAEKGYVCQIGAECEFYLFQTDGEGNPTRIPYDRGGYLDIAPLDRCENVRREICLCLDEMQIHPETSHHEQGPGQNEIDFKYSPALSAADNFLTFKAMVGAIAAQNGLCACFTPKPLEKESGSGLHVNVSLAKNGFNAFKDTQSGTSDIARAFIAGVLEYMPEMTAFANSVPESYRRLGKCEAPGFVSWAPGNRSQLIRIPAADGEQTRVELRSPDPMCNPYLTFALLISAGMTGIERQLQLMPMADLDLYQEGAASGLRPLAVNLEEALCCAEKSSFVRDVIGETLLFQYVESARRRGKNVPYTSV